MGGIRPCSADATCGSGVRARVLCGIATLIAVVSAISFACSGAAHARRTATPSTESNRDIKPSHRYSVEIGPSISLPTEGVPQQLWASAASDDPDRLLACTFEADSSKARMASAAYVSLDGGNTWMRTLVDSHSDWVSETACAAGGRGRAYFVAGVSDTSRGSMRHEWGSMEAYRSSDGGLSWGKPRRYPFIDWMALAVSKNASDERVYLFGNIQADGIGDAGAGGWREGREPMLASPDGLAFSAPVFPRNSPGADTQQAFPLGAAVLNDGRVVALFAEIPHTSFAVYSFDGSSYRLLSHVQMPAGVAPYGPLSAHMAIDRSGRFPGRLYAAIPAVEGDRPVLTLAHSDDGENWSSRVLLRRETELSPKEIEYFYAGVAVNPQGVVGIEWFSGSRCEFALSSDGGESVDDARTLGDCRPLGNTQSPAAAYLKTYNDRSPVKHPLQFSSDSLPGLTVQASTSALSSVQITADTAGRFHAFWAEARRDGIHTLTATIYTHRQKPNHVRFAQRQEITNRSLIYVQDEKFDSQTAHFSIDVAVRNIASTAIPYPRFLEVVADRSDCGRIKYLNPYGVSSQDKTIFQVAARPDRMQLFPRESSLPVRIEALVDGCQAARVSLVAEARALALKSTPLFPLAIRFRVWTAAPRLANPLGQ